MSKRTAFTSITPLPAGIPRQLAIDFLHDHAAMIDLNPLVTARRRILPPAHALHDELVCAWYAITDRIDYLPGGLVSGAVDYTAAFHDLPHGLQTHVHAPMGVDLREKWTVGGSMPGEEPEVKELGLGLPAQGLYIREDVEMRCSIVMAGFVKKTLKKAHGQVVKALAERAIEEVQRRGGTVEGAAGGGVSGGSLGVPRWGRHSDHPELEREHEEARRPVSWIGAGAGGQAGMEMGGVSAPMPVPVVNTGLGAAAAAAAEEEEEVVVVEEETRLGGAQGPPVVVVAELEAHPLERGAAGIYQMETARRSF